MIADSVSVPDGIKTKLAPYFPAAVLDQARVVVAADPRAIEMARAVYHNPKLRGAPYLRVIQFKSVADLNDLPLWANLLRHVQQAIEWGPHTYAARYVHDGQRYEAEASAMESRVRNDFQGATTAAKPAAPKAQQAAPAGNEADVTFVSVCRTNVGLTCPLGFGRMLVARGSRTPCKCIDNFGMEQPGLAY